MRQPRRVTGCVLFHPPPSEPDWTLSRHPALQWPYPLIGFSVDGEERLGSLHFASLHVPAIGSPTPLCQVSGFPGLELLWGFRRPGARALKAILDFSTISHPSMV